MRPNSADHRLTAESDDGGITFDASQVSDELIDPSVNGDIIRADDAAPGRRLDWLLFSNPASKTARTDLTVRLSCDNGATWAVEKQLHEGPSGYSTMAMLSNGRVGVFAEVGKNDYTEHMRFYSVLLKEIGRCTAARQVGHL